LVLIFQTEWDPCLSFRFYVWCLRPAGPWW